MLKNEVNGLFAPIKGVLYKGIQVFAYIQNEQMFFCNEERSTLNRDFLNELTATIGLVFEGNNFVYLDEYENNIQIKNVFIADKFGFFIFYECITGFEKMSQSLYVLNSSYKYVDSSSDYFVIQLYTDSYFSEAHSVCEVNNPILSNGSKEFGKYIENINKEFAIVQNSNGKYNVISSIGKIITESTELFIRHSKKINTVFLIENEQLVGLTLENNRFQTYKISDIWKASRLFRFGEIVECDGFILIYDQQGGLNNPELTYAVIDNENEIKSFFDFKLCKFNSITEKGVHVQTFYKYIKQEWNDYDDEPDYRECIKDSGYALISFDGVYMGYGEDSSSISIGTIQNNPGCDEVYNSTPGIYLVDENIFIESPGASYIRIVKDSQRKNYTAIVMNENGKYGMYFNENKILDYIADEINQLDYNCSDLNESSLNEYRECYDYGKSYYFKCITEDSTFIIYEGEVIAENVLETKFISFLCDGQWVISDYILITTNNSNLLCHRNEILYELGVGESIKGAYLIEDKAWFRIYDAFDQIGLLYEDIVVFTPMYNSISLGFMKDGTPLMGVPYENLFMGLDKRPFFEDESKHFLSMCSDFQISIQAIAYKENGKCHFVNENGEIIKYENENFDSIGPCANLENIACYVFSFAEDKFVFRPDENDKEDFDNNYSSYYEEPDYERDTFYALGGDDYDSFRKNGGSIDDMMDGMGF